MFSRNHPHRQPINAKNTRHADKVTDKLLSRSHFGENYNPVLWSRFSNLDMWPTTAHIMALLGINPETNLVRVTAPEYVNREKMLISGHSNPVAKIEDPYDLKPHPLVPGLMLPRTKTAQSLGLECLNVVYTNSRISLDKAKEMVSGYKKTPNDIIITFKIKDVLLCGGKIYRDASSSFENVLIIGLPKGSQIPFRII